MNKKKILLISEVISLLYVSLFLYTALSKLRTYTETREQLSLMPLMDGISDLMSWLLPVFEIIVGMLIFIPTTRKKGLYLGIGIMIMFTLYVAYLLVYHPHLPCTCGGFLQNLTWPEHLVFNIGFIALGLVALVLYRKEAHFEKETKYHLE